MSIDYLINANINRAKEGARVLEDLARFVLQDENLFKRIRGFRHSLKSSTPLDGIKSDLGGIELHEDNNRPHLMNTVQANALRIQEALRVLEETSKNKSKRQFKLLRYTAYQLHQDIYQTMSLFLKHEKLKGLYLIIDESIIDLPIKTITKTINKTSVNIVQFRNNDLSKREFLKRAIQFKELLDPNKSLIINNHLDIALDIADGIHLGQEDYPLERIRNLSPNNFIIGATCHNIDEAKKALDAGVSYLSIGSVFPTSSKKNTITTSLEELRKIRKLTDIPLCAIGGINLKNASSVMACKVDMIATLSFVWHAPDPAHRIRQMQKKILCNSQSCSSSTFPQ